MYDVTAWSVPLQYNIAAVATGEVSTGDFEAVVAGKLPEGQVAGNKAAVAYLVPWGTTASARFLAAALQRDVHVTTTDKIFKLAGKTYPRGTLIVEVAKNPADIAQTVQSLAKSTGADVHTTDTGWVDEGANFGSHHVFAVPRAKIAIAWDRPTNSTAAGATRFVIERQYGYPVSAVRTPQLANGDLSQFNVIILPDAGGFGGGESYAAILGPAGMRRLKDWVQAGGTLIGVGSGAVTFLSDPRAQMLSISQENQPRAAGETPRPAGAAASPASPPAADARVPGKLLTSEADFEKAIQPDTDQPDSLHGVLLRAKVDPEHWSTAGAPDIVNVLVQGGRFSRRSRWIRASTRLTMPARISFWPAATCGSRIVSSLRSSRLRWCSGMAVVLSSASLPILTSVGIWTD
jgi:hypothetical protein